jgi:tetratricopeptide (TPR) repeat protein
VKTLNQRAVEVLRARLGKLEADLPCLEDRCQDDDWTKAALDLTEHLFWLDEGQAWRWLVPRFIESLAYSRELRRGLVQAAQGWEDYLGQAGKNRLEVLRAADAGYPSPEEQADLLEELTRLESLGWLKGEGESERGAILAWQRGKLLYAREKYTEALAQYERAERALPEDGEALKKQLGEALYDLAGKWMWPQSTGAAVYAVEAERILPKVVEWLPEKQDAWYRLGAILNLAGKNSGAIPAYQRAIELDPEDAPPHTGLGNVYADLGQYDRALAAYQRAIDLDPTDASPHHGVGNVYADLGQYDQALAAYQRAVELDPKDAYPHNGAGTVYYQLGQYDQALVAYQRAIDLDSKYAPPHTGLGNVYADWGQYDQALAAYQHAIELDPEGVSPYTGVGNVYADLGQYDRALAAYQRAIDLDPKYAYPHYGLGTVYYQLGQYDQALAAYQRAIELDPKYAMAHSSLAGCYRKLGRESEAAEQIKIARELMAKENEYNRACFESICGNADAALALLKVAIEIQPRDRELARRDPDFDFIRADARFIALVGG